MLRVICNIFITYFYSLTLNSLLVTCHSLLTTCYSLLVTRYSSHIQIIRIRLFGIKRLVCPHNRYHIGVS